MVSDASFATSVTDAARGGARRLGAPARFLRRYSYGFAAILAVALLITNLIQTHGSFGLTNQLADLAPMALAAMASTPAIVSGGGGLDLSVSPLMILTSEIFCVALVPHGLGGVEAVPLVLIAGAIVGATNGLLILLLRVPPVIVTLAMYFVLIGVDAAIAPQPVYVSNNWITHLAGTVGPIPGAALCIGAPLLVWVGLGFTPYRRALYVVGSNEVSAFSANVSVGRVRLIAYTLGGLIAAVGGLAITAVESSVNASEATDYTLLGIAAVALGGTSLWGGRGGLVGSLLGAVSIYLLGNVLIEAQINPSYLQVMYGLMLLVAIVLGARLAKARRAS
jgi:ribose transport system permease protein